MFKDRIDAGVQLASKSLSLKDSDTIILAVPRGGVPVAYEVAKVLNVPMDIILVKKLGHPNNKEYAIGAVSPYDRFLVPHENVSPEYVMEETWKIRRRLDEMKNKFPGAGKLSDLQNKTVMIVDDGVATGNTLWAAIPLVKKSNPRRLIIAVPVISTSARQKLQDAGAEVISVTEVPGMDGIGQFYLDFSQTTDEEIIFVMKRNMARPEDSSKTR